MDVPEIVSIIVEYLVDKDRLGSGRLSTLLRVLTVSKTFFGESVRLIYGLENVDQIALRNIQLVDNDDRRATYTGSVTSASYNTVKPDIMFDPTRAFPKIKSFECGSLRTQKAVNTIATILAGTSKLEVLDISLLSNNECSLAPIFKVVTNNASNCLRDLRLGIMGSNGVRCQELLTLLRTCSNLKNAHLVKEPSQDDAHYFMPPELLEVVLAEYKHLDELELYLSNSCNVEMLKKFFELHPECGIDIGKFTVVTDLDFDVYDDSKLGLLVKNMPNIHQCSIRHECWRQHDCFRAFEALGDVSPLTKIESLHVLFHSPNLDVLHNLRAYGKNLKHMEILTRRGKNEAIRDVHMQEIVYSLPNLVSLKVDVDDKQVTWESYKQIGWSCRKLEKLVLVNLNSLSLARGKQLNFSFPRDVANIERELDPPLNGTLPLFPHLCTVEPVLSFTGSHSFFKYHFPHIQWYVDRNSFLIYVE